mmetsp:Transcript_152149/g.280392  ORF Transcript_152149/g.280392 Transcript_152149/m.280392 type:complete len:1404 (+) Transcript_152149:34-4245(+)
MRGAMPTTATGPRAGAPAVKPADPVSPPGQDQLAARDTSRPSSEAYAPRANEIARSDGVGLEQPPRSATNPKLREGMQTFGGGVMQGPKGVLQGGVGMMNSQLFRGPLKAQPSTKSSTSNSVPAKAQEVAVEPQQEKKEDDDLDDLPPWEYLKLPRPIKRAGRCCRSTAYSACVLQTQCSCVFVVVCFVVVGLIIGAGMVMMPPKIETSFDSFLKTDVKSSIIYDTWTVWRKLLADRNKKGPDGTSRLLQDGTEVIKDIILMYRLKDADKVRQEDLPGGITNVNCLHEIASFEQGLRALPKWQEYCGMAEASGYKALCDPGLSFAGYGLPTLVTETGNFMPTSLTLDGEGWNKGWEPLPMKTALFLTAMHKLESLFFPEDFNSPVDEVVTTMRSAFRFRVQGSDGKKLHDEWQSFFKDVLMPLLSEGMESEMVEMYYDGTGVENLEVLRAMWQDISWAVGAVLFVICYLVFHTRSIILSLLGLTSALLSLPLSYLVCAVLGGTTTVSFASALMIFLLVGFGCDMILVYTDFWRDSVQVKDKYVDRLVWTYRHGGAASLATTSVTALSFFANLASVIRALRQIGFFMGLCVAISWLLVTTIYVPSCLMDERCQRKCCKRKAGRSMPGRSLRERALKKWGLHLQRWRWLYLILPAAAVTAGLVVAAVNLDFRFESPNIFAEDHHHQNFQEIEGNFKALSSCFPKTFERPSLSEPVCSKDFQEATLKLCTLVWCDASSRPPHLGSLNATLSCDCVRRKKVCRSGSSNKTNASIIWTGNHIDTKVRWVGASPSDYDLAAAGKVLATIELDEKSLAEDAIASEFKGYAECETEAMSGQLLLQDWASGQKDISYMASCSGMAPRTEADKSICSWEDRCYCSKFACRENAQWQELPRLHLSPLPSSRRLFSSLTQATAAKVRVLFGIRIDTQVPTLGEVDPAEGWSFLDTFDVEEPWGQRNLNAFCSELTPNLEVVQDWCWMKLFRMWHIEKYQRFPTRKAMFIPRLKEFLGEGSHHAPYNQYIWWNDDQTRVQATYFSYMMGVPKVVSSSRALKLKSAWDGYVSTFDGQASAHVKGAIAVSRLWVEPEAERELLSSSVSTIIVLVVLAFMGMLLFTFSIMLSLFVVLVTLGVVAGLAFFLVIVANWTVGLVEGVAIIYFVGYAVTYALHIAHKYGTGGEVTRSFVLADEDLTNERLTRTIHALTSIGGAALGSAATTAGASLFLIPCTLVIFRRLGIMCLVVTVCSIIAAFGPLPAGLLICGPLRPGRGLSKTMGVLWRSTRSCRQRCASCCKQLHHHLTHHEPEDLPPWSPSGRKAVELPGQARNPGDGSPSSKRKRGDASPTKQLNLGSNSPVKQVTPPRSGGSDSPARKNSSPSVSRSPSSRSGFDSPNRGSTFEDAFGFDSEARS